MGGSKSKERVPPPLPSREPRTASALRGMTSADSSTGSDTDDWVLITEEDLQGYGVQRPSATLSAAIVAKQTELAPTAPQPSAPAAATGTGMPMTSASSLPVPAPSAVSGAAAVPVPGPAIPAAASLPLSSSVSSLSGSMSRKSAMQILLEQRKQEVEELRARLAASQASVGVRSAGSAPPSEGSAIATDPAADAALSWERQVQRDVAALAGLPRGIDVLFPSGIQQPQLVVRPETGPLRGLRLRFAIDIPPGYRREAPTLRALCPLLHPDCAGDRVVLPLLRHWTPECDLLQVARELAERLAAPERCARTPDAADPVAAQLLVLQPAEYERQARAALVPPAFHGAGSALAEPPVPPIEPVRGRRALDDAGDAASPTEPVVMSGAALAACAVLAMDAEAVDRRPRSHSPLRGAAGAGSLSLPSPPPPPEPAPAPAGALAASAWTVVPSETASAGGGGAESVAMGPDDASEGELRPATDDAAAP